ARTRLLCLENTVGGRAIGMDKLREVSTLARAQGIQVHLDGARFFNAVRALNCEPEELGGVADTVSVCLSKGLGAPAGSVLVGDTASIGQARRHRKILGGGMRQSGVLAAAGLYALEHNIKSLDDDHRRAERLGEGLRALDAGRVRVCTNMVYFTPAAEHLVPLGAHMAKNGILIGGQSPAIRLVLHRDVDDGGLDQAIEGFRSYFRAL
ncbi:MAG: low-specificity L-threonine aldolase, partial [Alphaproteobacteria bacterium]|nr:low-specificity L-threonine aldolase [Alphaproteobacteria bacterium]